MFFVAHMLLITCDMILVASKCQKERLIITHIYKKQISTDIIEAIIYSLVIYYIRVVQKKSYILYK